MAERFAVPFERTSPGLIRLALQYLRFGCVGVAATLTHVGLFAGLIELAHMGPLLANLIAFCVAFAVSFLGHFSWTFSFGNPFKAPVARVNRSIGRFFIVAIVGLSLNSLAVYTTIDVMKLSYLYAIVLMVTLVPLVLFALNKLWVFR